jgi:3-hydroxyisobutyrate dehydrogenase-like beta-hydroxyacid dehydrogenase
MKVHVVGVGKMGLPMAVHLHKGGHAVTADDAQADRLQLAREAGLGIAQGPQGLEVADVVLSSLPHDLALLTVGEQVARHAPKGAVFIDTSTVSQEASAQVAVGLQQAGVQYLRTTVSGNNKMAEAAQLTVMASGPRATFDAMLPLLELIGPKHFWLGEGEQARLMKLVVNLMIAQTSAMLAEALTLGRKGGLRWGDLWAVIGASAVGSPIVKAKAVQLVQRDFTPTFTVEQMVKDLNLIIGAAAAAHVPVPQTAATLQLMHAAIAQGDGGDDYAAVIKAVERAAGLAGEP